MNDLETGETVWVEYRQGVFVGMENDRWLVDIGDKIVKSKVKPLKDVADPPKYLKDANNRFYVYIDKTVWERDGQLVFYFNYNFPSSSFKSYKYLTQGEIAEMEIVDNPFWDNEKICDLLDGICERGEPHRTAIKAANEMLQTHDKEKAEIRKHCQHQWIEGEEENAGGQNYKKTCVCKHCGKEDTQKYWKL